MAIRAGGEAGSLHHQGRVRKGVAGQESGDSLGGSTLNLNSLSAPQSSSRTRIHLACIAYIAHVCR